MLRHLQSMDLTSKVKTKKGGQPSYRVTYVVDTESTEAKKYSQKTQQMKVIPSLTPRLKRVK